MSEWVRRTFETIPTVGTAPTIKAKLTVFIIIVQSDNFNQTYSTST